MYDYRLFFANSTLERTERERHPLLGHGARRVYRLATERRAQRTAARR